jgi:hypothetical protein
VFFGNVSERLNFFRKSVEFNGSGLGGAAWFDFNNDGLLDLFLTNGISQPNALFRNEGDGFFTNVAEAAGVADVFGHSGVVAGDIDNDGFRDVFLTGDGGAVGAAQTPVRLYHNNGNGTFSDITDSSGIVSPGTAMSAAFGDIDNDGFLDVFITAPGILETRQRYRNKLFRNNGDMTFTDVSKSAGVDTDRGACIAFFSDQNSDGWIDLFVGNCLDPFGIPSPNELFINKGDGTFTDRGLASGFAKPGFWMGFGPADFDNDGDVDIFVTNSGTSFIPAFTHGLFENQCDGTYRDVAGGAGVARFEFGWGCAMTDFDNDGYADIFAAGSMPVGGFRVLGNGSGNPGKLFFNDRDGTFSDFSDSLPVRLAWRFTSGVAHGDFDHDGFSDLVVVAESFGTDIGRPVLLRNEGNGNRSVTIQLEGTMSNRDAVGANVEVVAGELMQRKEVYAGTSFLSMDSQWLIFGIGGHGRTDRILVRWPSGLVERFENVDAGRTVKLVEGQGAAGEAFQDPCAGQGANVGAACGAGAAASSLLVLMAIVGINLIASQRHPQRPFNKTI